MTELFLTENCGLYEKTEALLCGRIGGPSEILRTENGKPYIVGNKLFFSLSHSGNTALIAISGKPCGVDLELVKNKNRAAVLNRFSADERCEIKNERDFLRHWTVRESYVKMLGSALYGKLKSLKYVGGTLYDGGKEVNCSCFTAESGDFVYSLCLSSKDGKPPEIQTI